MHPPSPAGLPCPVCGTPVAVPPGAPCPVCGLPAVGSAAMVVARIGATLTELTRDRDALLATLRAAAPGAAPVAAPVSPPVYAPPPVTPPVLPPAPLPPPPPRRRLSPQQVLLGLGALLLVAGAVAFVALAWTRLGLAFQAGVMALVTTAACAASAWTARRGLRATEEALAGAGAALLAVDLAAAYGKGLLGVDALPLRLWSAIGCGVVVLVAAGLGRTTRTTVAWPLVALLAVQPVPFLLMTSGVVTGPAGVAAAAGLAVLDVAAALRLRRVLVPVAAVLAGLWAAVVAVGGVAVANIDPAAESWPATGVVTAAAVGALLLPRVTAGLPGLPVLAAGGAGVTGLALGGSLSTAGEAGVVVSAALGVAALTAAAALTRSAAATAALAAGGGALLLEGLGRLADADRPLPSSFVLLSLAVPAALAAVLRPTVRAWVAPAVVLAPAAAVVVATSGGLLAEPVGGLLLAGTAAAGFGLAAARARSPEEVPLAVSAALAGVLAWATTVPVEAWGQVGLQLAVVGAAAGCYAVVAGRSWVGVVAVADLVVAAWVALGGAGVQTAEAYTLPAAVGLLVIGLPRLLARGRSWAAEGPAVAVGLAPSAFLAVTEPSAVRLVLVVGIAVAAVVLGTFTHRQAPFVVGTAVLAFVGLGRLGPYAPLLPSWLTLSAAGLLLFLVGATYERRRQQAREAVAWVAQMH